MTEPVSDGLVEVTQADREAAADYLIARWEDVTLATAIRAGEADHCKSVQAFARHRIESELARLSNNTGEGGLAEKRLVGWFFRECNQGTRRHLFGAFGMPLEELDTLGRERIALKHILTALRNAPDGLSIGRGQVPPGVVIEIESIIRRAMQEEFLHGDEWAERRVKERYNYATKARIEIFRALKANSKGDGA